MFTPIIPYSSTADGDSYFTARLFSSAWMNADSTKKSNALIQATTIMNRFNYVGLKTDPLQINEWPRNYIILEGQLLDKTIVPVDIIVAQFEIALALLNGVDVEKEIRNLRMTSRGFGPVRATYDRTYVPEYLLNGVPSATAWDYLSPYFDRNTFQNIKVSKVS